MAEKDSLVQPQEQGDVGKQVQATESTDSTAGHIRKLWGQEKRLEEGRGERGNTAMEQQDIGLHIYVEREQVIHKLSQGSRHRSRGRSRNWGPVPTTMC